MGKRIVSIQANRVVFVGPMATEVIRDRAAAFEALTGSYPEIRVMCPSLPKGTVLGSAGIQARPTSVLTPSLVTSISRMFLTIAFTGHGIIMVCPDAIPDLEVSFSMGNGREKRH